MNETTTAAEPNPSRLPPCHWYAILLPKAGRWRVWEPNGRPALYRSEDDARGDLWCAGTGARVGLFRFEAVSTTPAAAGGGA